jgi:hypothetical protein
VIYDWGAHRSKNSGGEVYQTVALVSKLSFGANPLNKLTPNVILAGLGKTRFLMAFEFALHLILLFFIVSSENRLS